MGSPHHHSSEWYICRYHNLTENLRKKCEEPPEGLQTLLLSYTKLVQKGKTIKQVNTPILPGYIFIKGHHDTILKDEVLKHLSILKNRFDNSFLIVNPRQMNAILHFAEEFRAMQSKVNNTIQRLELETLRLETEAEVSPQEHDFVEIIEGPCTGMCGFLKSHERSKKGTFFFVSRFPTFVPENNEDMDVQNSDAALTPSAERTPHFEDNAKTNSSSASQEPDTKCIFGVYPSFEIKREQIKILQFGTSNGHARDFIGKAYKTALNSLKKRVRGPINDTVRRSVSGLVIRYNDVESWNIKQKANLFRLLLTCHAVLSNHENFKKVLSQIENEIYPDFAYFADHKRLKKDKVAARKSLENFKSTIEYIKQLYHIVEKVAQMT